VTTTESRKLSATGLLAATCSLQLLQHAVRPATATAIRGRTLSRNHLTLRYHGQVAERFHGVDSFPNDVCLEHPAICMDLRLWECVDSPLNLHIPYTAEARQGILTSAEMFNPPLENAGGSQLLLAKSVVLPQGPATSEPQLVLWSGCNGSCTDCAEGTGKLWVLEDFPPCTVTASGGVFRLMYNRNPAYQNTHENCWSSLERSDRETEKQSMVQTICSLLSVCSVVGCVIAALLVCVRNSLKRLFSARSLQNTGTGSAAPAYAIGRAAIEKHFPVKYSNEGNLCIVCLLDIEEHEPGRRLQCGHEFHAGCIADWWTHRPRRVLECPLCKCKQRLVEDNPEGDEGQAPTGSVATAPETATADVDRSYGRSNEVEGIQVA